MDQCIQKQITAPFSISSELSIYLYKKPFKILKPYGDRKDFLGIMVNFQCIFSDIIGSIEIEWQDLARKVQGLDRALNFRYKLLSSILVLLSIMDTEAILF